MSYTNMTAISQMSSQQFIQYSNSFSAIPALILLFVLTHLCFVVVGVLMTEKRKRFFQIWIASFLFSLLFLIGVALMPNFVQQIVQLFN